MKFRKLTIFFVFVVYVCLVPTFGTAQSIHPGNVHFRMIDERIEVFYDLPANHDTIHVKIVFRKKSDPKFGYVPQFTSGDIGIGTYSGANRKIVWYTKKEPPSVFTGDGFYFEIKAKRVPVKLKVESNFKKSDPKSLHTDSKSLKSGTEPVSSGCKPLQSDNQTLKSSSLTVGSGIMPQKSDGETLYSDLNALQSGSKLLKSGTEPVKSGYESLRFEEQTLTSASAALLNGSNANMSGCKPLRFFKQAPRTELIK